MGKDKQADTAHTPMIKAGVRAAMITRAAVSALLHHHRRVAPETRRVIGLCRGPAGGPDPDEFKAELREIRERLDQLSADLATLSTQVQDLAAEIGHSTSS
jgi:hypothetical protein